jgi:hypothetical protein
MPPANPSPEVTGRLDCQGSSSTCTSWTAHGLIARAASVSTFAGPRASFQGMATRPGFGSSICRADPQSYASCQNALAPTLMTLLRSRFDEPRV